MRTSFTVICLVALILLVACGGGSQAPALPPAITSAPPIAASEGVTYSYPVLAVDPSGGPLNYSLTTAPVGSRLEGNTITWTPTAAQSRQPNDFLVTVSTSKGLSVTQSWTVTPAGTVHVSWIDTIWTESGPQPVVHHWTGSPALAGSALIPQSDGTFAPVVGTDRGDGHLIISNVPAGYFWLQPIPGTFYWTGSSNIDFGTDTTEPTIPIPAPITGGTTTPVTFNVSGFETGRYAGVELYIPALPSGLLGSTYFGDSLSQSFTMRTNSNLDYSQVKSMTAREYELAPLGPAKVFVLGPTAELKDLSLTVGVPNNVDVALTPAPKQSIRLNIEGSSWLHLFDHVAPASVSPSSTPFALSVAPYLGVPDARVAPGRSAVQLVSSASSIAVPPGTEPFFMRSSPTNCAASIRSSSSLTNTLSATLLDENISDNVEYQDPFPSESSRSFLICQQVSVDLLSPDGITVPKATLTNGAAFGFPVTKLSALIGPVEEPTINGKPLLTTTTLLVAQTYTLKWMKPSLGNATGYVVTLFASANVGDRTFFSPMARLSTSRTAMTLPLRRVSEIAHKHGALALFDNTAASPAIFLIWFLV